MSDPCKGGVQVSEPKIVAECWTCDRMPLPSIQNSDTPQHLTAARHIAFGHDVRPILPKWHDQEAAAAAESADRAMARSGVELDEETGDVRPVEEVKREG